MAASINASTSAGVVTTADTTGNLNLQSNGTTIVALTSTGAAVTGTQSSTGDGSVGGRLGVGAAASATYPLNLSQNDNNFIRLFTGSSRVWRIGASGANASAGIFSVIDDSAGLTRTTINSSGDFVVTNASSGIVYNWSNGTAMWYSSTNGPGTGPNTTASAFFLRADSATGRSISAGGTINASGADYAEYMTKCGDFNIAKGAICGVTLKGELTNVFADAISFMVKSTNPSYVGGDAWGDENAVGERPKRLDDETDDQFFARKAPFEKALETARQKVDRVAFAGQVPVNVLGATAGQYIIPVNDNGAIGGQAISNPTFEQYQSAVGKVIAIEPDGRAKIIVKVA